jgi:hypothetical protein
LLFSGVRLLAVGSDRAAARWLIVGTLVAMGMGCLLQRRSTLRQAARAIDGTTQSDDLFLTALLAGRTPSAYRVLVELSADACAARVDPREVVPYRWRSAAGRVFLACVGAGLVVAFLPQLDPFQRQERSRVLSERAAQLAETERATAARKAVLAQQENPDAAQAVNQAIEELMKTLADLKPGARQANFDALDKSQQQLGEVWRGLNEERRQASFSRMPVDQQFGATPPQVEQWRNRLAAGSTQEVRREVSELKELAKSIANQEDSAARRRLERELQRRLRELSQFAAQDLNSQAMRAALDRAMSQSKLGMLSDLGEDALRALVDSLDLAAMELDQIDEELGHLRQLEEAMRVMRLAGMCNGQDCLAEGDCASLPGYGAFYDGLLKEQRRIGPGMNGPGTGQGGLAPEDDTMRSAFQSEKSESALSAGRILLSWETEALAEPGEVARNFQDQLEAVRQGANEAVELEEVPPGYHRGIQRYFDSLRQEPGGDGD